MSVNETQWGNHLVEVELATEGQLKMQMYGNGHRGPEKLRPVQESEEPSAS